MNPSERSSGDDRCARAGGNSRREFLGRTIRGGALLAATTVLGNELRANANQSESQTNDALGIPSSDARMTTADLMADKLVEWGVSVVFGLPGDKIAQIMDALRRRQDKIRFVLVRHEEGAAFMASGYAKFTGKLGVCVSTAGPGAVHLLNGLYDAKFDGAPVLAITGAPPRALIGTRFTQGVDTISLYDDVTNGVYNELITGPSHLLAVADVARRAALARRGVAHLSFPVDVQTKSLANDDESLGVEWNQALRRMETSTKLPLQPQVVARQVSELLAPDALVALDCGSNTFFAARHISMLPTQKLAVGGNLSTMACGLPFVIAAKLAYPDRQCIAFVGDGGFTMLMGEFATAVKYKLAIKVVVLKNNHYSRIVSENNALGIPPFGTELQPIDFVRFAEACGGAGFACARPEEVRPALEAAWQIADRPALVEATIDNDADVSPPEAYLSSLKGA